MREIKFRAWNVLRKAMVDLKRITPLALNMDMDGLFIPFSDDFILMQYTGLKDKNGKEIYHKDYLKIGEFICLVEWEDGGFYLKQISGNEQKKEKLTLVISMEVSGNEYEG